MTPLQLDTFLQFKYPGMLQVSPDGRHFGFVVAKANLKKNHYEHTLMVHDGSKVIARRALGKNNQYLFTDDKKMLLNLQKNKAEHKALKEQYRQSHYWLDLETRSFTKAFDLPFPASLERHVSGDWVLLSAQLTEADHALYEAEHKSREAYIEQKKLSQPYEVIDHLPYQFNGRGFITDLKKQLFLFNTKTQTLKRLTTKTRSIGVFTLSENKKVIYYTAQDPQPVMTMTAPIYAYDLQTGEESAVYAKTDYSILALIEMQGVLIAAARNMKTYGMNENPDFFKVEAQRFELLAKHSESLGTTVGSDVRLLGDQTAAVHQGVYYFTTTIDDHSELRALHHDGQMETVWVMDGSIDGYVPYQSGGLIVGLKDQNLQEIYYLDTQKTTLKPLSRLNRSTLKPYYVAKPKVIEVKAPTHTVKGFVLLPENFDTKKRYPAILNIHGGPKTVYGQVYYHEMQLWANKGYVVFFANPRGSDGKGNPFADIRGLYGSIDYEDLMAFTDQVLTSYPNIDESQLFVTGGSYGGFMTNWIVGHTNRFKAAVTQRSISNWLSFYGTSDIGYYFARDQVDGHPLDDRDKLYHQSPIKYAQSVKTPLLFIHADQDHRCPIEQAQQFYAILKTQGVDTKLVWIKEENHELSRSGRPQARIKRLKEITEWFEKYTASQENGSV